MTHTCARGLYHLWLVEQATGHYLNISYHWPSGTFLSEIWINSYFHIRQCNWKCNQKRLNIHQCIITYLKPSSLQIISPAFWLKPSRHTVPHWFLYNTSTRPENGLDPFTSRNSVRRWFTWWRHHIETFDVYVDLRLNKRLCKQSRHQWFETPSRSLWRQWNGFIWSMSYLFDIQTCISVLLCNGMYESICIMWPDIERTYAFQHNGMSCTRSWTNTVYSIVSTVRLWYLQCVSRDDTAVLL